MKRRRPARRAESAQEQHSVMHRKMLKWLDVVTAKLDQIERGVLQLRTTEVEYGSELSRQRVLLNEFAEEIEGWDRDLAARAAEAQRLAKG